MINKLISGFCIFLIVFASFSVYVSAQEEIVAVSYDLDDDGVCDKSIDRLMEQLDVEEDEFWRDVRPKLRCVPTDYGDVCPEPPPRGEGVDMRRDSEVSGCSPTQSREYYDYWSVDLKEARPKRVKMNWLTDQFYGVDVFQPLELTKNVVVEDKPGEIKIDTISFLCRSYRTNELGQKIYINYLHGYHSRYPDPKDKTGIVIQFTLRRFYQHELSEKNIFGRRNIGGKDFEGIEIECTAQIISLKKKAGEKNWERLRGPPEIDEFEIFIPLERLVFHPPEKALEAGAQLADNIINVLDKIVPKLEKVSKFSGDVCKYGIGLQLLGNTIGRIPYFKWVKWFADKFWDGIGHTDWFKTKSFGDKGMIGGKAFCRYYACPREWCPYAEKLDREYVKGWLRGKYPTISEKELEIRSDVPIHESIILSARCLCFSGMYVNLLKLKVILEEWRRCLEAARRSEQYAVYCEQYLSKYLCEEIISEFMAFNGKSVLGRVLNKLKETIYKIPPLKRLREAIRSRTAATESRGMIEEAKRFYEEIEPIGRAHVKGNLGYREGTPQMICEYVFYHKIPELDIFERFNIDPLDWGDATTLGNWNSRVAYIGLKPEDSIYEYEISWTIIANKENFRYRVFLEREGGGIRNIIGHRYTVHSPERDYIVDAGNGVLRNAGDLVADYVQITSREQFDKLCFYVPSEVNEKRCFPPGSFDVGGPIGSIDLFEEKIQDSDGDGLADDWEKRYNCVEGRTDFENVIDKNACETLLKTGKDNVLNPNSKDSDRDGENDNRENPDGDAFTNYYEQQNNFHPNEANKDEKGKTIETSCYAQFASGSVDVVGRMKIGEKIQYNVGDDVKVIFGLGDDQRLSDKDELLLMGEIINTDVSEPYYDIKTFELKNPSVKQNQQFKLIKIKDDVKTGVYLLRLSLVIQGLLNFKECTDPKTGRLARKEFYLIIQNPKEKGCTDSDNGENYIEEGVCIDSDGVEVDRCIGNELKEWSCSNKNECVFELVPCTDNGLCNEGKCILDNCEDDDPDDNFAFKGTCIFMRKNDKGEFEEYISNDYCMEGMVVQFSCVEGECKTDDGKHCPEGLVCEGEPAICVREE